VELPSEIWNGGREVVTPERQDQREESQDVFAAGTRPVKKRQNWQ
jgi:hypothetical protein